MEGPSSMIRGVIFDLDGTLIRLPVNYDRLQMRLATLLKTTIPLAPLHKIVIERTERNTESRSSAFKIIDEEEELAAKRFEIIGDAPETVLRLQSVGYSIALVTLQGRRVADQIVSELGLDKVFEVRVTRQDSCSRVHQIRMAVSALSIAHCEAIMIGDRINDVNAANKVRCHSILVGKQRTCDAKADLLVDSVAQITPTLVESIGCAIKSRHYAR